MNKLVPTLLGILIVLSLNSTQAMEETDMNIGSNALSEGQDTIPFKIPNFFDYDEYFMLENFTGKLLMLDLMAAWCGPCNDAMPEMKELYQAYNDTGLFDILTIAIDKDEPRADLVAFHAQHDPTWPMAWDLDQTFWANYYTTGIPTYYLISTDGQTIEFMDIGWAGYDFYINKVNQILNITVDGSISDNSNIVFTPFLKAPTMATIIALVILKKRSEK